MSIESLVEEYANGLRCKQCRQAIDIGLDGLCPCQRSSEYQRRAEQVADWYDGLSATAKRSLGKGFQPMAAVRSTLTRERRRAGFRDMPTEPTELHVGGRFGGATVATDERLGLYRQHEIGSKWTKSTEKLTPRADEEPL